MRCRHAKRKLTPYLDGRLDRAERGLLEAHLAGCAGCAETHAVLRAASSALASLGPAEPRDGLVERSVRAAFTEERRVRSGGLLELLRWPALATAAAAAVLAVGLTLSSPAPKASAPSADDAVAALMAEDDVELDTSREVSELLAQEER